MFSVSVGCSRHLKRTCKPFEALYPFPVARFVRLSGYFDFGALPGLHLLCPKKRNVGARGQLNRFHNFDSQFFGSPLTSFPIVHSLRHKCAHNHNGVRRLNAMDQRDIDFQLPLAVPP